MLPLVRAVYASVAALLIAVHVSAIPAQLPALSDRPVLSDVLLRAGRSVAALTDPPREIVCEESGRQVFVVHTVSHDFSYGNDDVAYRDVLALVSVAPAQRQGVPWYEDAKTPAVWQESRELVRVGPLQPNGPTKAAALTVYFGRTREYPSYAPAPLPRVAPVFLHPANQPRFEFSEPHQVRLNDSDVLKVDYREKTASVPGASLRGSFWIDGSSGQVVRSVLTKTRTTGVDEVTVTYALNRETGLFLPVRLQERSAVSEVMWVDTTASFSKCHATSLKRP